MPPPLSGTLFSTLLASKSFGFDVARRHSLIGEEETRVPISFEAALELVFTVSNEVSDGSSLIPHLTSPSDCFLIPEDSLKQRSSVLNLERELLRGQRPEEMKLSSDLRGRDTKRPNETVQGCRVL